MLESKSPPKVSVVVLSYNRAQYTDRTLAALASLPAGVPFELVVVDNGSHTEAIGMLTKWKSSGVIDSLLLLPENLGTSPGYNKGFTVADKRSAYLTKLDNDICVTTENWLRTIVSILESNPTAGIVATDIANHSALRQLPVIQLPSGHSVKDWKGFRAGGGGMTFSRQLYEQVGGFAEQFPSGLKLMPDDVSFYRAVSERGLSSYYACDAQSRMQRDIDFPEYTDWKKRQYHLLNTRFFGVAKGRKAFKPCMSRVVGCRSSYQPGESIDLGVVVASPDAREVGIGMSIRRVGDKRLINDPANDTLGQVETYEQEVLRRFVIPKKTQPGDYEILLRLLGGMPGTGAAVLDRFKQRVEIVRLGDNDSKITTQQDNQVQQPKPETIHVSPSKVAECIEREFVVLGHPRSGTGYMAQLFQLHGVDVRHEAMGEDGISSWMFATSSDKVPYSFDGSAPSSYQFRRAVHVVRNPLQVIASTAFTEFSKRRVVEFMQQFVSIDREAFVPSAVQSYLGWNQLIQARKPDLLVRVEEATDVLPLYLKEFGRFVDVPVKEGFSLPSKRHNARRHQPLTWKRIRQLISPSLYHELRGYTEFLGYPTDD